MNLLQCLEGKIWLYWIIFFKKIFSTLFVIVFRRMREVISNKVLEVTQGSENIKVMLAGLSNVYTHYITTWEEYQR